MAFRGYAWLSLLGVLGLAPCARAANASIPIRVELGGESCSSLREVLEAIQKRNGRVRLAAGDEPASRLRIDLDRHDAGLRGELLLTLRDGSSSGRVVDGATCQAVLEALALTAALALQTELPAPDAEPTSTPSTPSPVATPSASPVASSAPSSASGGPDRSEGSRLAVEVGAHAAMARMVAPHLNVGGGLLARARLERDVWLSPSLTLSVAHTRNELFESSRHAALRVTGVSLIACPLALRPVRALRIEPCWVTTGAELQAVGRELSLARSVSRSWWGTGAIARVGISAARDLSVEVEGGALVPLVDRRFVALPSETLLGSTPRVSPLATAGVVYAL